MIAAIAADAELALLPGVGSAPFAPLSLMRALLTICVTPDAIVLLTMTTNLSELDVPAGNGFGVRSKVHVLFALLFGAHDHPAVLCADTKVVFAGTTSVILALGAAIPPTLEKAKVYVKRLPGATVVVIGILTKTRSGKLFASGVVTVYTLLVRLDSTPLLPSSPMRTVLVIVVIPGDGGLFTRTANCVDPLTPESIEPTFSVHIVPETAPLEQPVHIEAGPKNAVSLGTVSVITTFVVPMLPVLV